MESSRNLFDLLDIYVLDKIFSKIYELEDQLNLAVTHPILEDAFKFHSRKRFREINLATPEIVKFGTSILSIFGADVISLSASDTSPLISLAAKNCTSLQSIALILFDITGLNESLRTLLQVKSLESIDMSYWSDDWTGPSIIESLQNLPNLKKLWLCDFPNDELIHVNKLVKLENLKLKTVLNNDGLPWDMCSQLIYLRIIELHITNENFQILENLAQNCPLIEKFTLRTNIPGYHTLPHFPKLSYLTLISNIHSVEFTLANSASQYANHLEHIYLRLGGSSNNLKLLGQLTNLKTLECEANNNCFEYIANLKHLRCLALRFTKYCDHSKILTLVRECKCLSALCLNYQLDNEMYDDEFKNEIKKILVEDSFERRQPFCIGSFGKEKKTEYILLN